MKRANKRYRRSNKQETKRNWIPLILLAIGVLLLGYSIYSYYAFGADTVSASLEYAPEDVAHEQPIFAVHEMGDGPAIPFLPNNQPQPDIVIPEKFYNFGSVGPRDVLEWSFIIRNEGDAPLTISRAYTTCGCTTAEISASVIPPGQVATVKLIFDAGFHDASGQTVRRGLIIENNDPRHSEAEIWVQAAVRSN